MRNNRIDVYIYKEFNIEINIIANICILYTVNIIIKYFQLEKLNYLLLFLTLFTLYYYKYTYRYIKKIKEFMYLSI